MRLTGVDLNLLVAFDALMSERSVTRAAERLSIGQSAMSATLARLRRLFDDPLLVRQGRVLVTTSLAESLIDPVHEALTMIEQTLAFGSHFDPSTDHRTFSVVASDYVTLVFLRPLLARLTAEAPNVRLHLRPVTADYRDLLRRNQIDLLVMPREILGQSHEFPTSPLFSDRYVVAVDRDNPDIGTTITVEEFSKQPYLAYNAGPLPSLAEQQLDAAGITRNLEVSTQTFVLAPYLLRGTRLLTLIHERLGRAVQDQLDIRLLEPPLRLSPITEVMSWTQRHDHDPAHVWLRGRLHDLASDF